MHQLFVDREVATYAVELADAARRPARLGLEELRHLVDYGASPRGPIGLIQSARALALLRGRRYVLGSDVRDLAADVLRHRLVLSYEALSDGAAPTTCSTGVGRDARARRPGRSSRGVPGGGGRLSRCPGGLKVRAR